MKYFQTWMYVSRMNRIPVIGKYAVKTIQFVCALRGHEPSKTEWGYGGGEYADVWCRWCNHAWQAPVKELPNNARAAIYRETGCDIKVREWEQCGTEYSDT